jgi:hypothetical protein
MPQVYFVFKKGDFMLKYINPKFEVGKKMLTRVKDKKEYQSFKKLIEYGYKINYLGNHLVKGVVFNRIDYFSKYQKGINLNCNYSLNRLDIYDKVDLIIAVEDLLTNLFNYKQNNGYLIGDWVLSNLIFNQTTKRIINIDLEGLYVYSPYGLNLSWNGGENNYKQIKKRLHKLTAKIILTLSSEFKKIKCQSDLLTILSLKPNGLKLHFPFKVNNHFLINKKLISYGENVSSTKYYLWNAGYCYYTNLNNNNNIFFNT